MEHPPQHSSQTGEVQVDTGAKCNVISEDLFTKMKGNGNKAAHIKPSKVTLTSFSGHKTTPVGKCTLLCDFKNTFHPIEFQVVRGQSITEIIGLNTSEALGLVNIVQEVHVGSVKVEKLKAKYKQVLEGIGCMLRKQSLIE